MEYKEKFMVYTIDLAKQVDPVGKAKIASMIVHRGKVIAVGKNSKKTHPLQKAYCSHPQAIHLHAEIDVISKALKKLSAKELQNSELYVARVKHGHNNTLETGLAKPCEGCQRAIKAFKINHIFYTE